jgi:hypothetical protein
MGSADWTASEKSKLLRELDLSELEVGPGFLQDILSYEHFCH